MLTRTTQAYDRSGGVPDLICSLYDLLHYKHTNEISLALSMSSRVQMIMDIARALQQPEIRARIAADGAEAVGNTPDEFAAYVKSETLKWGKVAKRAGIEPE